MEWMLMPLRRYADFSGRSRRKEYWMYFLLYYLVFIILFVLLFAGIPWPEFDDAGVVVNEAATPGPLVWIAGGLMVLFALGTIVPSIAVTVRRFHDQDMTGWLYLLSFIPYIGWLIVFVFMCIDGTRGPNQYGDDPKDPGTAAVFE